MSEPLHLPCPVEILRCPITGGALHELSGQELGSLNNRIAARSVYHDDGSAVEKTLKAALQSADRRYVYRIDDGIVVLLPALAIVTRSPEASLNGRAPPRQGLNEDKRTVQRFYDEIGWTTSDAGRFVDAEKWEDLRPVAASYIHRCHQRVHAHLSSRGKYLLDVASGSVQYPEYLAYSANYEARICVDISLAALRAAQRKVGARGIYILGDITNLPLRDNLMDAAVSLHTIYHVPAEEQAAAFLELFRVLAPGASAVVVYNWRSLAVKVALWPARIVTAPWRIASKLRRRLGRRPICSGSNRTGGQPNPAGLQLYFHAHPYRWFARRNWPFPWKIAVWRSVSVPLLRAYVHPWFFGRALLTLLYALEETFPSFTGRFGAYAMIVISKPACSSAAGGTPQRADQRTRSAA
jgi:SAM-dependent methyltransferase/uncharacterized protein YbaR (Trm112 family)